VDFDAPVYAYRVGSRRGDLSFDDRDSAPGMPRGIVIDGRFNWEGVESPNVTWPRLIVYEAHVKGFTMRHPDIPEYLRGTYGGFAHPVVIDYLQKLGVTAVELLPVHHAVDEGFLEAKGLTNYWGYNTAGVLRAGRALRLHRPVQRGERIQGHGEGAAPRRHRGSARRRLQPHRGGESPRADAESQGPRPAGLLRDEPRVAPLLPGLHRHGEQPQPRPPADAEAGDGLARYWVQEMRVDGFRFDLATTLGRTKLTFDRNAPSSTPSTRTRCSAG
jgi:glycogen operon protein